MALQTSVLREGEWVTRTINVQEVLKQSTTSKPARQRGPKPPRCGIITSTVVESPRAQSILPVRLRSAQHSDVAFVGEHFVHIRELRDDGQLHDIIHKNDFGDRIRSAKVIGSLPHESTSVNFRQDAKSDEAEDIDMLNSNFDSQPSLSQGAPNLAPQMLVLVLERGDCIFLVLQTKQDGTLEFVTSKFEFPQNIMSCAYPGFHLVVDPSSRYLAVGCSENLFTVYELESWQVLNDRYRRNVDLRPVKTYRRRQVNGSIHMMEFLFPQRQDDYHIILLLIVVRNGVSRMAIYEWEAGDPLRTALADEKKGHRLPEEHQLPILLIPLMVRTAFFAVYQDRISVGKDVLIGAPNFDSFEITNPPASELHAGHKFQPLWTAWTRPFRLPQWTTDKDNVYLAREDGVVMFLDIDSDNILGASQVLKTLDCNISGAFCSLFNPFADILIVGGDSGPGAIWQLLPRQDPLKIGVVPNWSPTVDFVTTDEFTSCDGPTGVRGHAMISWSRRPRNTFTSPDRIFAISGKGLTGNVTEYRHGLQANIGIEFDCEPTTTDAWLFPANPGDDGAGYFMLQSMPDRSSALHLSSGLNEAIEVGSESVPFDLSCRTIAAAAHAAQGIAIQVTEKHIICASPENSFRAAHRDILQWNATGVLHAAILENLVVLSRGTSGQSVVELSRVGPGTEPAPILPPTEVNGEVTCLSFAILGGVRHVLLGLWENGTPSLARLAVEGPEAGTTSLIHVNLESQAPNPNGQGASGSQSSLVEAFTSIVCINAASGHDTIILGTRDGAVVTLTGSLHGPDSCGKVERFGLTSATVSATSFRGQDLVFVCCDSALFLLTDLDISKRMCFRAKHRVWPVDAQVASKRTPNIRSVKCVDSRFADKPENLPILLTSDSQLLIAALLPQPRQVQRSIPLLGTPRKMIYSHHLECLVVAMDRIDQGPEPKPTLKFIDPDSGEDLSQPLDKHNNPTVFVSGLGQANDTILDLSEWFYQKDNNRWYYLLVSTKLRGLLVIQPEKESRQSRVLSRASEDGVASRIRYRTIFKKPTEDAVSSAISHPDGIIFCEGTTLRWDILNVAEKRLQHVKSFEVPSPVTSMRMINGKIVALTSDDSVHIINPSLDNTSSEMTLDHTDPKARPTTHMIDLSGGETDIASSNGASMLLLCDRANGLAGLWVPWQHPGRDCEVVFEAELPAWVRKFCRGRTRPGWLHSQRAPEHGVLPSTVDGAEILGLCLDGSMQHFTLVGMEVWAVLRLVQNLALASPLIFPFTYDVPTNGFGDGTGDANPDADYYYDPEPEENSSFEMQIDGDVLRRCLEKRCLGDLFGGPHRRRHVARLAEMLGELDGGSRTVGLGGGAEEDEEQLFELVYDIIEYYLAPIF